VTAAAVAPSWVWRPRVWAPDAAVVALRHGAAPAPAAPAAREPDLEARVPMSRGDDGWWSAEVGLPHGTDYAFEVDGSEPLPDPRSPWQPYGVHGPSRVLDTGAWSWTDSGWPGRDVRGAVTYELHVGTFTPEGTLDAAADRLDHLVTLGVDVVELMPLAPFPGVRGWGYDGVDLFAVHEPYGGPDALHRFVDAAHARGLAVCLDVVPNHLGPSGNYLSRFGPYFTERHHTPWGAAVNLDGAGAREVRAFLRDACLRWLRDLHVDVLRLDAVHALLDDSPRHWLADLSDAVAGLAREVGRPLSLVAESDRNDPATVTSTAAGGHGMTAQWADDVHHALHAWLTGERHGYYVDFGAASTLAHALTRVFVHEGGWSTFRAALWGAPVPADVDGHRFVVFASDHDQVGNRALGDRPSERLDDARLAVGAAAVLCSPFTPMLFMGEEWGTRTPFRFMTDHQEPELAEAVRRGRTEEFAGHGWVDVYGTDPEVPDPQAPATAAACVLDWSEPGRDPHARMLVWYRRLIALRAAEPELASGDRSRTSVDVVTEETVVLRRGGIAVVLHRGDDPATVPLGGTVGEVLAAWEPVEPTPDGVRLAGPGVAVVRVGM
jgi:maltooligosyltrehalose trehalohydrolase